MGTVTANRLILPTVLSTNAALPTNAPIRTDSFAPSLTYSLVLDVLKIPVLEGARPWLAVCHIWSGIVCKLGPRIHHGVANGPEAGVRLDDHGWSGVIVHCLSGDRVCPHVLSQAQQVWGARVAHSM